jgi:hypothetical protein
MNGQDQLGWDGSKWTGALNTRAIAAASRFASRTWPCQTALRQSIWAPSFVLPVLAALNAENSLRRRPSLKNADTAGRVGSTACHYWMCANHGTYEEHRHPSRSEFVHSMTIQNEHRMLSKLFHSHRLQDLKGDVCWIFARDTTNYYQPGT